MTELLTEHCNNRGLIRPKQHFNIMLSVTKELKNGNISINGFSFKGITHITLKGTPLHGMEFIHLLRNGEEITHLSVKTVRGDIFTHSLHDRKVVEEMLGCCPNLKRVHNS